MMIDYCELALFSVQQLHPYQPGKPIEELQRELKLNNIIKLASNENPFGPSPKAAAVYSEQISQLARYPDGNGFVLKQKLSGHYNLELDNFTLGNGSNDILELIARAYVSAEHEVIFSEHAFAVYPLVTQAIGATAVVTPALNWGHDLKAMSAAITEHTRLIFIANPNNPTGTWLDHSSLDSFLKSVPENVLVVLDEAYYEYASHACMGLDSYPDGLALLAKFPNLIITRTFSKAYGLAGLRVGYSISGPQISNILNRIRQPFNVNHLALVCAAAALDDQEHINKSAESNKKGLDFLSTQFEKMDLAYIPSIANFISFEVQGGAQKSYDELLQRGIIVRPVANYNMPNYLRVSVGSMDENEQFINGLKKL